MNTAHLVAWLTCLVVAFLACVIGVLNSGRRIVLERDLQHLQASVETLSESSRLTPGKQLERAREELAGISAELHQMAQPPDIPASLREKLSELERRLRDLQDRLR